VLASFPRSVQIHARGSGILSANRWGLRSSRPVFWPWCFSILQERFDSQQDSLNILRQRTRPVTLYLLKSRE